MTMNKFWEFIISLESEYGSYRKKIMNRFSLSAAETDILMFLSNNPQCLMFCRLSSALYSRLYLQE